MMVRVRKTLTALTFAGAVACEAATCPETSRLFEKRTDSESGIVSYRLRTGLVAESQQTPYFAIKAMTDDGRFLVFNWYDNESKNPGAYRRGVALVDFETDSARKLPEIAADDFYYLDAGSDEITTVGPRGFYRIDLRAGTSRKLCDVPAALTAQGKVGYYCYHHPMLTKDRKRMFLESRIDLPDGKFHYVQGMVDLATGTYESWGDTDFYCNHGQLCPSDDSLALCAWEGHWEKEGQAFRRKIGYSPRMWFIHRDGRRQLIPPSACDEEVTHETWSADGKGHYWCSKPLGVWYRDRATGNEWNVCPYYAEHAHMSVCRTYVVFDEKPKGWWRGSPQRVGFWNRKTKRRTWIYGTSAPICPRTRQSTQHPDGHPQFTCRDRYVSSTHCNADGHLDLLLTPVAELVKATTEPDPRREHFTSWADGKDPLTVGTRLCRLLLSKTAEEWVAQHVGPEKAKEMVTYPLVCTWYGALEFSAALNNVRLQRELRPKLERMYAPFFGPWAGRIPKPNHVDNSMFGCLPLALYPCIGDPRLLETGLEMAEAQWREPRVDEEVFGGLKPYDERVRLWQAGYTPQTRMWMDDMFMITILQLNAYKATGDGKYADRAAREMAFYLDRLQKADGLFDHGPGAPYVWARGAGWLAAGMAMLLKDLPDDNPQRARIMTGYVKMMEALLKWQRPDGLWGQLVDDPDIWAETSGSAMFAYGFIEGVNRGWLDVATYAPAARRAYLALVDRLDEKGALRDVCCGTNVGTSREFYAKRSRRTGDQHGQAPMLWCCAALVGHLDP